MATRLREIDRAFQAHPGDARNVLATAESIGRTSVHPGPSSGPVRILLIENHQVVAEALEALVNDQPGLAVIGCLGSVEECRAFTMLTGLEILVVDFHLADGLGTDAVQALRENGCAARVIFLTNDDSDRARLAAIEAGASAFVPKSQSPAVLIDAIRRVARGESLVDPSALASLVRKGRDVKAMRDSLTQRELDVLRLLAAGVGSRDIAARLGIGYSTVRAHLRSLSAKLGSHSKIEVVVRAREMAIVA